MRIDAACSSNTGPAGSQVWTLWDLGAFTQGSMSNRFHQWLYLGRRHWDQETLRGSTLLTSISHSHKLLQHPKLYLPPTSYQLSLQQLAEKQKLHTVDPSAAYLPGSQGAHKLFRRSGAKPAGHGAQNSPGDPNERNGIQMFVPKKNGIKTRLKLNLAPLRGLLVA